MSGTSNAYLLEKQRPAGLRQLSEPGLPDAEATGDVSRSSLNYKDGPALEGRGKITRRFPMVCGIGVTGQIRSNRARGRVVIETGG